MVLESELATHTMLFIPSVINKVNHHGDFLLKRLSVNFSWLFVDKVIRLFGGLFVSILLARYLGPDDFGILSYSLAFTAIFLFLSDLGLRPIVVRELLNGPEQTLEIMGSVFYIKLIGSIVAIMLIYLSIHMIKTEDPQTQLIVLIIACGYVFQSFDVIDYYFQAKILSKYIVWIRSFAFISTSSLKLVFIFLKYEVVYFAMASLIEFIIAAVFMVFVFYRKKPSLSRPVFVKPIVLGLIRYSWPLMLSSFFVMIYMRVDQIMIEYFLEFKEVGLYSVAVRISEAWYFMPTIITSTLLPYFISLRKKDYPLYIARMKIVFSCMFWLSVVIGIGINIWGRELIILLFGTPYEEAYTALYLNIWAGIFVSFGVVNSLWIIPENLQKWNLICVATSALTNIAGNVIFIPQFGISGAAITTLLSQGVAVWGIPLCIRPMRKFTLLTISAILPIYSFRRKI